MYQYLQGKIYLSFSFERESSVMRVRLRVVKNTHYEYALAHYKYALAHYEYALAEQICISRTNIH